MDRPHANPEGSDADIAVIGMDCRFPGANNATEFWENLVRNVNSVREFPPERWDAQACHGDRNEGSRSNSRWAGLIEDVDKFDAAFFRTSATEAQLMDPQQRIMLELCWGCMEDAGYPPEALAGTNTGVYIGVAGHDYRELLDASSLEIEAHRSTGGFLSLVANRVSHFFNLRGPSMPFDTACSSTLFALHHALRSLRSFESGLALVGGINVLLAKTNFISFSKTGMLSPRGQCRTFDAGADGYVRGEGAGVLLLKRLAEAIRDGDNIHGVVKGSAINHGGRSQTLTSPNAYAQSQVIQDAYRNARVSPDRVSYIEAHGTGTPMGDPMEITGLKRAWRSLARQFAVKPPPASCGIGTVKTHIGHLEPAAGIAGIIKVLLAFRHRQLPGLTNFTRANPDIDLAGSPFYLVTQLQDWRAAQAGEDGRTEPLFAGVSAFGFGGTNAHVVLGSYD